MQSEPCLPEPEASETRCQVARVWVLGFMARVLGLLALTSHRALVS